VIYTKTQIFNIQDAYVIQDHSGTLRPDIIPKCPYEKCVFVFQASLLDAAHATEFWLDDDGKPISIKDWELLLIVQEIISTSEKISVNTYAKDNKGIIPICTADIFYKLIDTPHGPDFLTQISNDPEYELEAYEFTGAALNVITLLNCKNVKYIDYDPNKGIPWRNKQGKKKPKPPYISYKILEIQPMKQQTQVRGTTKLDTISNARLHTVRGHFKTFTPEHPLFGKYSGTYWWGDCVKGNAEFGLAEKSYRLKIDCFSLDKLPKMKGDQ
jgi:hypothetical protein